MYLAQLKMVWYRVRLGVHHHLKNGFLDGLRSPALNSLLSSPRLFESLLLMSSDRWISPPITMFSPILEIPDEEKMTKNHFDWWKYLIR